MSTSRGPSPGPKASVSTLPGVRERVGRLISCWCWLSLLLLLLLCWLVGDGVVVCCECPRPEGLLQGRRRALAPCLV